jgi:hypothetical protein
MCDRGVQVTATPLRGRCVTALLVSFGALLTLAACTTFVQPTSCEAKASSCGGIHDARFCDIVAFAVEGADCAALGLLPSQHFCVVTRSACTHTDYAVKDRDCRVVQYEAVGSSWYDDCPAGARVFVSR